MDRTDNATKNRHSNIASPTVDIPEQGEQRRENTSGYMEMDLTEGNAELPSPTKMNINPIAGAAKIAAAENVRRNGESEPEPKRQKQEMKTTDSISKEAQEQLDLFQAPQGMVSIKIPSGKKFALHIDVLVDKCDYFRAALTGNFREADTNVLTLPDVSDNTFGFFLKWLYSGNLKPEYNPQRCNMHNESTLTVPNLLDLWFFADYLRAPALQNNVIINVKEKFRSFTMWSTEERFEHLVESIKVLWKPKSRTDRGELAKPLRDLFLDFVANPNYMPKAKSQKLLKSVPASFLREFALTTVERNYSIDTQTLDVMGVLEPHGDHESNLDESDFECELESVFMRLDITMDLVKELRCVWDIEPEKYFVKDAKKARESD